MFSAAPLKTTKMSMQIKQDKKKQTKKKQAGGILHPVPLSELRAPAQALAWIKEPPSEQHSLTSSLRTRTITRTHTHTPLGKRCANGWLICVRVLLLAPTPRPPEGESENSEIWFLLCLSVCACARVCMLLSLCLAAFCHPLIGSSPQVVRWHIFQSSLHESPVYVWLRVQRKFLKRRSKRAALAAR